MNMQLTTVKVLEHKPLSRQRLTDNHFLKFINLCKLIFSVNLELNIHLVKSVGPN